MRVRAWAARGGGSDAAASTAAGSSAGIAAAVFFLLLTAAAILGATPVGAAAAAAPRRRYPSAEMALGSFAGTTTELPTLDIWRQGREGKCFSSLVSASLTCKTVSFGDDDPGPEDDLLIVKSVNGRLGSDRRVREFEWRKRVGVGLCVGLCPCDCWPLLKMVGWGKAVVLIWD
ncbi:hypothetical protein Taro_010397, partial [Colocasia esculenta]|nr:hypothetical protein [Colocasia esculenta]